MAWHIGIVLPRRDPAFSPNQAPIVYNTVRDHRAPEQQRKNQQKIQTAAAGCAGCARRGGSSTAAAPAGARGEPAAAAAAARLEAAAEHSWSGAAGAHARTIEAYVPRWLYGAVCGPSTLWAAWRTTRRRCSGRRPRRLQVVEHTSGGTAPMYARNTARAMSLMLLEQCAPRLVEHSYKK